MKRFLAWFPCLFAFLFLLLIALSNDAQARGRGCHCSGGQCTVEGCPTLCDDEDCEVNLPGKAHADNCRDKHCRDADRGEARGPVRRWLRDGKGPVRRLLKLFRRGCRGC